MAQFIRSLLSVLTGALLAIALTSIVEGVGHLAFPLGDDVHGPDRAARVTAMQALGVAPLLVKLASAGLGSLLGAYFATRLSRRLGKGEGLIVGLICLVPFLLLRVIIPFPAWYVLSGVALIVGGSYLGAASGLRRTGKSKGPIVAVP